MKLRYIENLNKEELDNLCKRGTADNFKLQKTVAEIIQEVKLKGDAALFDMAELYEKRALTQLYLSSPTLHTIAENISESVKNAIDIAFQNIWNFHEAQLKEEAKVETMPGVFCWREIRAIQKVGLYIPGGTAVLPSTLLMLGIPARLANCEEIIVCTPANQEGIVGPEIAYILGKLNIQKVYLSGGAQAIAAMAFGTETFPKVNKICGPGNAYVTEAKIQLQRNVAIDFPAGPSEVLIIADETADPNFVASDLLAQAEHGSDSQAILVSPCNNFIEQVQIALENQLAELPRQIIARAALENSFILKTTNLNQAIAFSNLYAPEHLIVCCGKEDEICAQIQNAGSVFLGNYSPESAGDYASGTNHTLPTSAFAKAYSGVSVDTFIKKISFQKINSAGLLNIGPSIETLADVEGLFGHKNAVSIRLNSLNNIIN
ncbi:MAG: histidinol dehydrogenase [Pedobacter sp.]|nr:MAG: histidinol dehydrogenase [Pedobacter sp.]